MLRSTLRRYYQNVSLLGAYSPFDFLKQLALFPADYYLKNGKSTFPLNITLALTLRCNARCSMCALQEVLNTPAQELTFNQYKSFIDRSAPHRPGFVLYGGEPFLRKDILDIVRLIKSRWLSCGVFTNGLLLNKDIIKELISLKLDFIVFSLYGPREIHDKIVGVNGAYEKIIENAAFFKNNRRNTRVIIHCTVSQDNLKHLDQVADISVSDSVRFGHLTFVSDGELNRINREFRNIAPPGAIDLKSFIFSPDPAQTKDFIDNLTNLKRRKGLSFTPELSAKEIADWYAPDFKTKRKCLFAWRGVFIAPSGDVYPCMGNFYYKMGNILEEDLATIWNNDKFTGLRRLLKKRLLFGCARCCRL